MALGAAQPVAALYVETDGCYFNLPGVEPWDAARDARLYRGPYPAVAHPECGRWGRFWPGSPRGGERYNLGEDEGKFAAALTSVRNHGGVIEHPAVSRAWGWFGLSTPPIEGGWVKADAFGGWTCHVEQGHYGHDCPKPSWLYAVRTELPALRWGPSGKTGRIDQIGGKFKQQKRQATPPMFRDQLLDMARSVYAWGLA